MSVVVVSLDVVVISLGVAPSLNVQCSGSYR